MVELPVVETTVGKAAGRREGGSMTPFGIARVVGVVVIVLLAMFGVQIGEFMGPFSVSISFQVLNTIMLFLLVTFGYEWLRRQPAA